MAWPMLREALATHTSVRTYATSWCCPKAHRRHGPAEGGLHTPFAIMTTRGTDLEATKSIRDLDTWLDPREDHVGED